MSINRKGTVLLSIFLLASLAISACRTATEEGGTVSREVSDLISEQTDLKVPAGTEHTGKLKSHIDKCCLPAMASEPTISEISQTACHGTRWSLVIPGACYERKDKICTSGLVTRVTVKEYSLQWDASTNKCIATETGSTDSVQVDTCLGGECS